MRRIFALAAVPLLLAGCGSDETPTAATVTVTAGASADQSQPTAEPDDATETAAQTVEPEADVASETEEEDLFSSEPTYSERGYLMKVVGQKGGVVDEDTGELLLEFTVDSITVDYDCPGGPPPENGHYLGIVMSIETFPSMATSDYGQDAFIDTGSFTILGPDGTRENDSFGNAYECLSSAEQVPSGIGPGEKASGTVVVDTKYPAGTLLFGGSGIGADSSWEYQYGDE